MIPWPAGESREVDASEIGLAPGKWPPGIEYEGFTFHRQDIIRTQECISEQPGSLPCPRSGCPRHDDKWEEDEVLWGEYKEEYHAFNTKDRDMYGGGGRRLTIFND